jgi:hypothetical protein
VRAESCRSPNPKLSVGTCMASTLLLREHGVREDSEPQCDVLPSAFIGVPSTTTARVNCSLCRVAKRVSRPLHSARDRPEARASRGPLATH